MTGRTSASASATDPAPAGRARRAVLLRLLLGVGGAVVLAYGVRGLLTNAPSTAPRDTGLWLLGGLLAHDLVLGPTVGAAGWLLIRLVPGWARSSVQGGLVVAGVVVLASLPVLLRQDAPSDNSSLLPLDYRAGLAQVLTVVAVGTAALVVVRAYRRHRRARPT